jgi:hypothetical protein
LDRNWFQQQIDAFAAAPALYLASVAAIAIVVWFLCSLYYSGQYSGQVSTLKERLSLAENQRDEFKSKLSVSSPDEAKTKVLRLEEQLAALNQNIQATIGFPWPSLTDREIDSLADQLRKIPKHRVQIMFLNRLGRDLASSFLHAFQKAGWEGAAMSDGGGAHLGVIVGPGASRAGILKQAIEAATTLKIELDKPTQAPDADWLYLFVGINATQPQ